MKYFMFPQFRNNRQQIYLKGLQIMKICNVVELGKFIVLTKEMSVLQK